jgi:hypothetical protein
LPQIAPKKHKSAALWQNGMRRYEDRFCNGAYCPLISVVLGNVIDIGESN